MPVRIAVHVHPGAKHPHVGGTYGQSLVVRVRSRAVDGAATAEVVRSLATAFGVRPAAVSVVRGASAREKVIDVNGDDHVINRRLRTLLESGTHAEFEER